MEQDDNKKVLLRERKRHTARRVVSTPSVVLPGYPPGGGGTRTSVPPPPGGYLDLGTPPGGVPGPWYPPPGGTRTSVPPLGGGTQTSVPPPPRGGTQTLVPPPGGGTQTSVPPLGGGTRTSVPPPPRGVPGPRYPPRLPHGILGNVAKHYGIWVPPPCGQTDGWMEGQTRVKTLPSLVLRTRAVMISNLNGRNSETLVNVGAIVGQNPIFGLAIPDSRTALVSAWNMVFSYTCFVGNVAVHLPVSFFCGITTSPFGDFDFDF